MNAICRLRGSKTVSHAELPRNSFRFQARSVVPCQPTDIPKYLRNLLWMESR